MRTFSWYDFDEDGITENVITDYEILLLHWGWWSREVFKRRPDNTFYITPDNCIEDFIGIHWCKEIK